MIVGFFWPIAIINQGENYFELYYKMNIIKTYRYIMGENPDHNLNIRTKDKNAFIFRYCIEKKNRKPKQQIHSIIIVILF